jgi:membrane protein implicated in regulation of membrane protease activity
MSEPSSASPARTRPDEAPPSNKALLVAAAICLLIPLVALMWVGSYAKSTPRLWHFPFFFWYQFLWVFITAALTYTAHRLVLLARRNAPPDLGGPRKDVR